MLYDYIGLKKEKKEKNTEPFFIIATNLIKF